MAHFWKVSEQKRAKLSKCVLPPKKMWTTKACSFLRSCGRQENNPMTAEGKLLFAPPQPSLPLHHRGAKLHSPSLRSVFAQIQTRNKIKNKWKNSAERVEKHKTRKKANRNALLPEFKRLNCGFFILFLLSLPLFLTHTLSLSLTFSTFSNSNTYFALKFYQ